jgi:hypothetical protein
LVVVVFKVIVGTTQVFVVDRLCGRGGELGQRLLLEALLEQIADGAGVARA